MENKMKITKDNFVWKILTLEEAEAIFEENIFEVFTLYPDDSEKLVTDIQNIISTVDSGLELGIEVGKFEININVKEWRKN